MKLAVFKSCRKKGGKYVQRKLAGGKLRILDIIEELEQDLQVPVLHPGVAQAWEIMKRLHVRQPKSGYGRLLAELPY